MAAESQRAPQAPTNAETRRSPAYTVSEADVQLFAAVSLDLSRVHTDAAHAQAGVFGRVVGHGLLGLCLAEGLLSRTKPMDAVGTAWTWEFTAPFFPGDTLWAESEIVATRGRFATERVRVLRNEGEVVQRGSRRVTVPDGGWPVDPPGEPDAPGEPDPAFAPVALVQQGPVPPSTTGPEHAQETGVFFEDLAVGDAFATPAVTLGPLAGAAFAGLTAERGPWFADIAAARALGLPACPVPPIMGLALVEGLKYALAPDRGVGIPMASVAWRWFVRAPVFADDTLRVETAITAKRASAGKTDRGLIAQRIALVVLGRGIVQEGQHVQLFRRRPA